MVYKVLKLKNLRTVTFDFSKNVKRPKMIGKEACVIDKIQFSGEPRVLYEQYRENNHQLQWRRVESGSEAIFRKHVEVRNISFCSTMKNVYINGQTLGKLGAKNFRDCIIESRKLLNESDYQEVFVTSHSISDTDFACKNMFPKELKSYEMFKVRGNNMRNVTLLDNKCDIQSIISTVQESRNSRQENFQDQKNHNYTNIEYYSIKFPGDSKDDNILTFKQVDPSMEFYKWEEDKKTSGSEKKYLFLYNQQTWYISKHAEFDDHQPPHKDDMLYEQVDHGNEEAESCCWRNNESNTEEDELPLIHIKPCQEYEGYSMRNIKNNDNPGKAESIEESHK